MQVGSYALAYQNTQSLQLTFGQAGDTATPTRLPPPAKPNDKVSLSPQGLAASAADKLQRPDASPATGMLKHVLKQMFGLDVQQIDVAQLHMESSDSMSASAAAVQQTRGGKTSSASALLYEESHSQAFSMRGTITTKDGQQLEFSLDFAMESHISYQSVQASSGKSKDASMPPFQLGNDAGAFSGASVLAGLSQMLQAPAPQAAEPAKAEKNLIPLLAHFKLWKDDPTQLLADQHLRALLAPPKPDEAEAPKPAAPQISERV